MLSDTSSTVIIDTPPDCLSKPKCFRVYGLTRSKKHADIQDLAIFTAAVVVMCADFNAGKDILATSYAVSTCAAQGIRAPMLFQKPIRGTR
ncbi:MAG: hypothetical protein IKN64_08720 [Desulfovibrio sp.]|nr:hypothetical protein [Desulfovibrio sp.]